MSVGIFVSVSVGILARLSKASLLVRLDDHLSSASIEVFCVLQF